MALLPNGPRRTGRHVSAIGSYAPPGSTSTSEPVHNEELPVRYGEPAIGRVPPLARSVAVEAATSMIMEPVQTSVSEDLPRSGHSPTGRQLLLAGSQPAVTSSVVKPSVDRTTSSCPVHNDCACWTFPRGLGASRRQEPVAGL